MKIGIKSYERERSIPIVVVLLLALLLLVPALAHSRERPVFDTITVDSAITPPVAQYILSSIGEAEKSGAEGLIILLDTPGGLDTSMREIVKGILSAPLPVFVYVAPSGARAASAGVIIATAAHIAAMAPGTNIGAAHPVSIGIGGGMDKTMAEKVENDAAAYARGLAEQRGRNAAWVEDAVRKSVSITAEEALKKHVIDFVAEDVRNLLDQANGKTLQLAAPKTEIVLNTKDAVINKKEMSLRQSILTAISNPNIAYILMLLGLAGLYFEFTSPGAILPGIIGGISLLLSFFAFQTLPVNYAGILLILFGVLLFVAELMIISHGLLTTGGIISLILGSLMLFDSPDPAMRVSYQVLVPAVATISLFFVAVISLVIKAHRHKQYIGDKALVGEEGEAVTDIRGEGKVFVDGEYWQATSEETIEKGSKIIVIAVEGIKLKIARK